MTSKIWLIFVSQLVGAISVGAQGLNPPLLVLPEAKGHRLVLIDPRARAVVGQIMVPGWPHEVAFSEDGRTAYAPSYSDAIVGMPGIDGQTIDVIDMQKLKLKQTWDLGKPLRPHKPMLTGGRTLLVSTELAQALSIVSLKDGTIEGQISTGARESHMFVQTLDGKKVYTVNLHAGSISVLDLVTRRLVKVIAVSQVLNRIALSSDGRWLFATDGSSPNVAMIDTAKDEVTRKIPVSASPFSLATSPDGRWLLVGEAAESTGRLEAIDLADLKVKHSFEIDRLPLGIRILGNEAFVACYQSGNVNILDLTKWHIEPPILNVAHGDGLTVWSGLH